MGSFQGHALPGTLFLIVGAWHVWSSVVRYISNPKEFRFRVWNPVPGFDGRLKYLELYALSMGSFIHFCIELRAALWHPSQMNHFEHTGMLLMFFIFSVVVLLSEKTRFLPMPEGALCLIAATAFCAEYFLFYFHSTTHRGLEGYYHGFLVFLTGLCIVTAVAGALWPTCFPIELCKGIAITLQGIWFFQTAFVLYGPLLPDQCHQIHRDNASVTCNSKESELRGELLANFQLFMAVLGVLVGTAASYGFAALRYGQPGDLKSSRSSPARLDHD